MNSAAALPGPSRSAAERNLMLSAMAALLLGTAVYLLDRDWASAMFLEPFVDYQWSRSAEFGALGGCLPSLLHAYAICVLLVAALWPWPRTRPWVCLLWFILASFLEWLQSGTCSAWFTTHARLLGEVPLMAYLKNFSVYGHFDTIDMIASGVGCLAALTVTISIGRRSQA